MSDLIIRPVCAEDRADWSRLWNDYLAFYDTNRATDQHDQTWARILDEATPMFSLVAVRDGKTIGMANYLFHPGFWDVEDLCYLNDLFVDPAVRGSGAGEALLEAVATEAKARNASEFYWLTAQSNSAARKLYDRVAQHSGFLHYVKDD
ncbi:MAG: GNAT family N-acetyltransferase [Paracoccaceae bacterium]